METDEIIYELSDEKIMDLSGPVPIAIQLRMILNNAGFKFMDDYKLSSVIDEKPIPLGKMTSYYDANRAVTKYKQVIKK
jgi:hypothetical protein